VYNSDNAEVKPLSNALVRVSYDYLKQIGQLNLFLGGFGSIAIPEYEEEIVRRHNVGLRVGLSGVKDPIVWNTGLEYAVGLPKEERGVQTWEPGNMQGNVGIISLFNSTFGFGLSFIQSVRLAPFRGSDRNREETRTASVFRPEVLIIPHDNWYVRFNIDIYAYPITSPAVFTVLLGVNADFPKKK
jgi:hypothetical protein